MYTSVCVHKEKGECAQQGQIYTQCIGGVGEKGYFKKCMGGVK